MAVDVEHVPAEAVPLGVHRLHILDDGHGVDELQTVAVDDETDIVQMVLTGKGRRFPDLSLLLLSVADEAEYLLCLSLSLQAQSHAVGNGQPCPKEPTAQSRQGSFCRFGWP